jgi:23S rRNA (uracil1939-C5)-methyltransferase
MENSLNNEVTIKTESEKDALLTISISRFDDAFDGIAYIGRKRYVVPKALPKELVEVKCGKVYNNIHYAKLENILEPSIDRVESPCKYNAWCGGCSLLHMNYEAGLKAKTYYLNKKLAKFNVNVPNCISDNQFGGRNKVHLVFNAGKKDIEIGFFNEESHSVVDVPVCLMHGEWYTELVRVLKNWVRKEKISIYNPKTGLGALRFAVARRLGNAMQLTIVTTGSKLTGLEMLYSILCDDFGDVSLYLNINDQKTNEVLAGRFVYKAGDKRLNGEMLGIKYSLSPNSFFQVNENMAKMIYNKVIELIDKSESECVVDAYSGIGIVSMLLAKAGHKVISIEIVDEAVDDAKMLAKDNGVEDNIELYCGDCKDVLGEIKVPQNSAFFVDPPRKGLGEEVVEAICKVKPKTIIYLSCNPDTLVTDLDQFILNDYIINNVSCYDMFANTRHLETLVCFTKRISD